MFKNFSKKEKAIIGICLAVVAVILLFIYIIHQDKFTTFFGAVGAFISVFNPIFVGIIIAYLLNPIEKFFIRRVFKRVKSNKAHKALSILCTYTLVLGLIVGFFFIIIPQIMDNITEMPSTLRIFKKDAEIALEKFLTNIENSDFFSAIMRAFDIEHINISKVLSDFAASLVNIESLLQTAADASGAILGSTYSFLKDFILGFFLSIYMLAAKDRLLAHSKKLTTAILGEEKAQRSFRMMRFANKTFGGFIQGKLINAFIIGFISWVAFAIFGIPYALLLALIVMVTDLIPIFGPFIGAVPCAFIVLISNPEKLLILLILTLIIQQVDGNYICPMILGESTGISSLGVFVSIIIMGGFFGIPGMLLGVPTFAVIAALIERIANKRLAKQGLSFDITDYYNKSTLDDNRPKKRNAFTKLVDLIFKGLKAIFRGIGKLFTKFPKIKKKEKSAGKKSKSKKK